MRRDIATPSRTKEIMDTFQLQLKKSLGQNFIIDANVLRNIVTAAQITKETGVIEIGPGIGALTEQVAKKAKKVVSFEIDKRFLPILEETLQPYENITIHHADILQVNMHEVIENEFAGITDLIVVANLPYYITTPILMNILEKKWPISRIVVMIQKEVADRIVAEAGTKDYGTLSIATEYYAAAKKVMDVPATVFIPQPQVQSAVIKLTIHPKPPIQVMDETYFFKVVRASFLNRRKTILNNLVHNLEMKDEKEKINVALHEAGIEPQRRGETLSSIEFARLSDELYKRLHRD